jgi:hypothetical protein
MLEPEAESAMAVTVLGQNDWGGYDNFEDWARSIGVDPGSVAGGVGNTTVPSGPAGGPTDPMQPPRPDPRLGASVTPPDSGFRGDQSSWFWDWLRNLGSQPAVSPNGVMASGSTMSSPAPPAPSAPGPLASGGGYGGMPPSAWAWNSGVKRTDAAYGPYDAPAVSAPVAPPHRPVTPTPNPRATAPAPALAAPPSAFTMVGRPNLSATGWNPGAPQMTALDLSNLFGRRSRTG